MPLSTQEYKWKRDRPCVNIIFLEIRATAKTSIIILKRMYYTFYSLFHSVAIEDNKPKLVTRRATGDKVNHDLLTLSRHVYTIIS